MIASDLPGRLEELSWKSDQLWLGLVGLETLADGSRIEPGHITPLTRLALEVSSVIGQVSEILEQGNPAIAAKTERGADVRSTSF